MANRKRAERAGAWGESWAALFLTLKGFRIVARRFRTPLGEIDIVARRGRLVLIVEVKRRATLAAAMDAVSAASQGRIARTADLWLARQPDAAQLSLRFDLIAILPRRLPVHVADVFRG